MAESHLAISSFRLTNFTTTKGTNGKLFGIERRIISPVWSSVAWQLHNPCEQEAPRG